MPRTITLTLSDEEAAIVSREAAFAGKSPREYAHAIVTGEAALSWIGRTRRREAERFDAEIMCGVEQAEATA